MNGSLSDKFRATISKNWQTACFDVGQAAIAAGRTAADVRIVGVTKYVDSVTTSALIDAGCNDLGEARPQQLSEKVADLASYGNLRWHLIGSLQRNKVRRTLENAQTIHSIDSVKLLQFVDKIAGEINVTPDVMLEVNISGDASKHGFSPDALLQALDEIHNVENVKVVGLMGMAGLESDLSESQAQFATLRQLRDRILHVSDWPWSELSMGMSGDFREAIAEGATMVRIGSRLFEGIDQ